MALCEVTDAEVEIRPLLVHDGQLVVDYKGRPVNRSNCGGWRSACFIICLEMTERFAHFGISSNLINFMTGPLGLSTATAAEYVNVWGGSANLLPLLGAFIADAFLGRFRTIFISGLLCILGLGLITVSAVLATFSSPQCENATNVVPCSSQPQLLLFYIALFLLAIAQGGHKPCAQAFGADQFDAFDPEECKRKSSFFNWWSLGSCVGTLVALLVLSYIQDNINWGLGFGIPCIIMGIGMLVFVLGNKTYRFSGKVEEESAFVRIGKVFVKATRNWRASSCTMSMEQEEVLGTLSQQGPQQFKFLNKALLSPDGSKKDGNVCSITEVEEAKMVLRLVPIWATCLVYAIVSAQFSTLFTKQGVTLDRSVGPNFVIPAAALQSLISLTFIVFIPIYDRIFVPVARSITKKPSGITKLQRIGTGICFSILSMVMAALVEMKRLKTANDYGLVDSPGTSLPMSVWWLVPQYVLVGTADVFAMVGLPEFFYDQVPSELRSVGLALYLSILGIGSFLSSILISIVEKATGGDGRDSWFSNNLNRGHLDYFYWLLAGLSAVAFIVYLYFAKSFIPSRAGTM